MTVLYCLTIEREGLNFIGWYLDLVFGIVTTSCYECYDSKRDDTLKKMSHN